MLRWTRTAVVAIAATAAALLVGVSAAGASQGSTSQTFHFQSVQQWGTPIGPATKGTGCTSASGDAFVNDFAFLNLTGNGVQHQTVNKAGDGWFTSTFTGSGTVTFYPLSSLANITFDNQGNITSIDIVGPPDMVVNARVTEWFGGSFNNQNAVAHGTVNAQGTTADGGTTVPAGEAVSLHQNDQARWAVGADQNGPPTFTANNIICG